jgi:diguanylate cyclase (GGDEF)-like protein/PAS domain S-box-containing protein
MPGTHQRLVSQSAVALFLGAGAVTIANSYASPHLGAEGVNVAALHVFGVVSLASGLLISWRAPETIRLPARLAIAVWGLVLLAGAAAIGRSAVTPQAPISIPIFMMVVLVWLGLTSERGTAAAFAPVTIGASAYMAFGIPGSRVEFSNATLVIVVSVVVAETIAWAMCELRKREELLAVQAMTDPLTGLLNRAAFAEALEDCCARREHLMLAFVDLNDFKEVNDTFGHQVGDEVLVEIGRRLRRVAREEDVVARFGGDEFVVLFRIVDAVDTDTLLCRIRSVIAEPWTEIGPPAITASVGIVDDHTGSQSPAELLRAADAAMYSRKHGTTSAPSPARMSAQALAHHRAAMDGLGGSFTVLRRVQRGGDDDWLVIEANARVRDIYGPVCGDPVGMLLTDLDRYADNSATRRVYSAALSGGERQETEIELALPDAGASWRRLITVPVDVDVVAVLTWDITAEKAAQRALADAEEHSRAVVESAADAIITVDGRGLVRSFNRAAEAMFETARDDAIGRPYLGFVPAASLVELRHAFDSCSPGQRVEVALRRASGEEFPSHVAISRVTTGVGDVFTAIVRDVTEQLHTESALRSALERDELTGLPNLRSLLERTEHASVGAPRDATVGLLFVDLDRFTLVNDSLGHDVGDELLVAVADRIERAVRDVDTVTRVSGDHFVVLCESVESEDALVGLAGRIQDALRAPFHLAHGREVFTTASIGAVLRRGSERPRDLLRFAHTAMYRAKRRGPAGVRLFSDEMSAVTASRLDAETALRRAIDRHELSAYYQPIVDLETGATEYCEALIRWDRPGVGLVLPDQFIPVAEETSLIVDIGTWMLHQAIADCAGWQSVAPGVGVSINVSAHQFRIGDLPEAVRAALTGADLAPELVILEITESVMLEHSDWNLAVLERIRELGVRLALDDFGTGYSALTHLRRLPIDTIKVDRSFLQRIETEADLPTIRAIVELARAHDIDVVAEGIETEATRRLVRSAGCQRGQGFLFAHPAPFEAMVRALGATATRASHAPQLTTTAPPAA